ncbi:DUF397 domain-containing protein [Streptomyces beigongshangae]|uniref:DUF397 domain-containing protein n=1 Tax=Streptomyces beigongshangae TaxID=2841597 RepID=UPI001C842208|nr:DUF397 domain-containing protein [Streptomyces sp. REN17]
MRHTPELSTARWRKSSYSNTNGGECVEIAEGYPHLVPVRDSKNPHGPVLVVPATAWAEFVNSL